MHSPPVTVFKWWFKAELWGLMTLEKKRKKGVWTDYRARPIDLGVGKVNVRCNFKQSYLGWIWS